MLVLKILFWLSLFLIFWAMAGYKISLRLLAKIFKNRKLVKDYSYKPTVTVMVVAHNEEKVMLDKLNNIVDNDYPKDKIDYLVTSDASTDATNSIVEKFIDEHPEIRLRLHKTVEHKGKTNAQNEGQKLCSCEILVMTDANAMFEKNAISEIVACFTAPEIAYVAGHLTYVNGENSTAKLESAYWKGELWQREIESNIRTIVAGNGAIYACRNSEYYDFPPKRCHDGAMPTYYATKNKRAIYNPDAVAYEKAGESNSDEYKRKVRMFRGILTGFFTKYLCLNVFKYGWYSYFCFGHRICRTDLWLNHTVLLITSALLCMEHWIYAAAFIGQIVFYLIALINSRLRLNKYFNLMTYYSMTILAQWNGVYNILTGKSKATWEKAESTR